VCVCVCVNNLVLSVLKCNSNSVIFDISVNRTVCRRACLRQAEA